MAKGQGGPASHSRGTKLPYWRTRHVDKRIEELKACWELCANSVRTYIAVFVLLYVKLMATLIAK